MKNHDPMTNKTKGPIPLPAGEVPTGTRCVSLCIPDDNEYYRMLVGAIYELTHWNNYERDDSHKATLVAQAWRRALMQGLLQCNQFRNNGGRLEFSSDGGATWTPVTSTPASTDNYDPKNQGTQQPARTGDNKACLAARNAAACIEVLHAYMVQWYADWGTVLTIALFLQAILVVFLPLDWPIALAIISFDYLAQSMITLADALNTGSWTETVTDTLTCILACNADFNGNWNQAEFDAIRVELQAKGEHIYDLIDLWLDQVIGVVGLNNAGTTTSIASYDCGSCDCNWCYEFDFAADDFDFTPMVSGGFSPTSLAVYTPSSGFTQQLNQGVVYPNNWWSQAYIERALAMPMTKVKIYYAVDPGNNASGIDPRVLLYDNGTLIQEWDNVGTGSVEWTGTHTFVKPQIAVEAAFRSDSTQTTGTVVIYRLHLEGPGPNPFGEDNCP